MSFRTLWRFVDVSEEEINFMKENAIPRNTKHEARHEAAILKYCPSAIITLPEVIIAEYDAIRSQWQSENFYNHLSNYTNRK